MQYKRIADEFTDTRWENAGGYTEICQYYSSGCMGHHAVDLTYFDMTYFDAAGDVQSRTLSNFEVMQVTNPKQYKASYVYENFEWSHCTGEYEFPALEWGSSDYAVAADGGMRE